MRHYDVNSNYSPIPLENDAIDTTAHKAMNADIRFVMVLVVIYLFFQFFFKDYKNPCEGFATKRRAVSIVLWK